MNTLTPTSSTSPLLAGNQTHRPSPPVWPQRLLLLAVIGLLATQALLWTLQLGKLQPRLDVVPPAPTPMQLGAAALGDKQALFRWRALELQAFGDSGGRVTPLGQFDYQELVRWFDALDSLDPRSSHAPNLAAFVFGQTRNAQQLRLVTDYIRRHAQHDLARQYRWTTHAAMLAAHRLNDPALAFDTLDDLKSVPGNELPAWVRMMPAFLHAQVGETEAAADLLQAILSNSPDIPATEQRYLQWQIKRLQSTGQPTAKAAP